MLLNHPPARVWSAVTDYSNYATILPYLHDVQAATDEGDWQITGNARSLLGGYWPFTIHFRQERSATMSVARWDENGQGEVRLNRGSWEVIPHGKDQTLLVLSLEAEVRDCPTFILRNVFMHRLKVVLRRVGNYLDTTVQER
jgi:hypothetical protein